MLDHAPTYDDKKLLNPAHVDAFRDGGDVDPAVALAEAPHHVFAFAKRTHGGWGMSGGE